jgi:hypothetical protein
MGAVLMDYRVPRRVLIADRTVDDRFDEDAGKQESQHSTERAGQQATRDDQSFHGAASVAGETE